MGLAALCRTRAESPGFLKDEGGTLHKTGTIKRSRAPHPAGIRGAPQMLTGGRFRNVSCWVF